MAHTNPAKPEHGLTEAQATVDVSAMQQELENSQRDLFGLQHHTDFWYPNAWIFSFPPQRHMTPLGSDCPTVIALRKCAFLTESYVLATFNDALSNMSCGNSYLDQVG